MRRARVRMTSRRPARVVTRCWRRAALHVESSLGGAPSSRSCQSGRPRHHGWWSGFARSGARGAGTPGLVELATCRAALSVQVLLHTAPPPVQGVAVQAHNGARVHRGDSVGQLFDGGCHVAGADVAPQRWQHPSLPVSTTRQPVRARADAGPGAVQQTPRSSAVAIMPWSQATPRAGTASQRPRAAPSRRTERTRQPLDAPCLRQSDDGGRRARSPKEQSPSSSPSRRSGSRAWLSRRSGAWCRLVAPPAVRRGASLWRLVVVVWTVSAHPASAGSWGGT